MIRLSTKVVCLHSTTSSFWPSEMSVDLLGLCESTILPPRGLAAGMPHFWHCMRYEYRTEIGKEKLVFDNGVIVHNYRTRSAIQTWLVYFRFILCARTQRIDFCYEYVFQFCIIFLRHVCTYLPCICHY
jgi:hypothetical protein